MSRRHWRVLVGALGLSLALLAILLHFPRQPSHSAPATQTSAAQSAPSPQTTVAGEQTAQPVIDDDSSAQGTFRGRVIDAATRAPVREFELQFYDARGVERLRPQVFSNDDGRFEWRGVPLGTWTLTARARGYQRFVLHNLQIGPDVPAKEIVLPLVSGLTVRGRVYDEATRNGIAGASIEFREAHVGRFEGKFRMRPRVSTRKDGTFVLEGVPPGSITIEAHAPDYAGRELTVFVDEKAPPLEIGLSSGGLIAGYLATSDGATPTAGTTGLFNLDHGFGGSSPTGPNGEFEYKHLPPGRYRLSGKFGGAAVERDIVLAENQRIEGIVLAVGAGRSIRGFVTGLRPEELVRVQVGLGDELGMGSEAQVAADGSYVLHGVLPGRVRVVAEVPMERQIWKIVEMPADADLTVNLEFPRGVRLSGYVTRNGKPVSQAWLEPRPQHEGKLYVYPTITRSTGAYVLEDLEPGEYSIAVAGFISPIVNVSRDTVFDIEIPDAQLSGRVLEETGKAPVAGAEILLWPVKSGSAQVRRHALSDHFGQFAVTGLEPGEFVLSVYKPGYEMLRERLSYGSPVSDMTVRLRRSRGVEIRVRDADSGKPLGNVVATETLGGRNGSHLRLGLDANGSGFLPAALAGSMLTIYASGYQPLTIPNWNGQALDLELAPQTER